MLHALQVHSYNESQQERAPPGTNQLPELSAQRDTLFAESERGKQRRSTRGSSPLVSRVPWKMQMVCTSPPDQHEQVRTRHRVDLYRAAGCRHSEHRHRFREGQALTPAPQCFL
mmetsp:Transcript_4922/g.8116  ORF Transcript_4922/g.8116 Transcript_4922/m.8116 type:complete len:114 (+) Transcript_4922:638-979(+)